MAQKTKLTPLMEQYWRIKNAHTDKVLLFRMGDFFEIFHEDAVMASPIIGAVLTRRNKKVDDAAYMCGVPHHSVAGPINKLLKAGHKVAICDQVEDPKDSKGIVKRAVTRILSPGMVYDSDTLDSLRPNYLCSYDEGAIAFLETTTGEAFYYLVENEYKQTNLIEVLSPSEIVLDEEQYKKRLKNHRLDGPMVTSHVLNTQVLEAQTLGDDLPLCAKRLLSYAVYMQDERILQAIEPFQKRALQNRLGLSGLVLRHLEIFETYRGEQKGSLFYGINRTKTASGARLLKNWLTFPLTDKGQIQSRLDKVELWSKNLNTLKKVRETLSGLGDIQRSFGKISNPNCNPRDMVALASSLRSGLAVSALASSLDTPDTSETSNTKSNSRFFEAAKKLISDIEKQIIEEPPVSSKNGFFTKEGFSPDLDEFISLTTNSQKRLENLEAREKEKTGIHNLKIRYNNVFGYYIEVTKTHQKKVPARYIRKQTLIQAERYITEELGRLEMKILSAKTKREELEKKFFQDLRQKVLKMNYEVLSLAHIWSEIDVLCASAWLAVEHDYCRPEFVDDKKGLGLKACRHPVVEQEVKKSFVPNDIFLNAHHCLLLTGPNMAGKSTLMRQVASLVIMAQSGLFVPAAEARLPVFDQIFTRIGASDSLTEGLSTFMVEMTETAEMLKKATPRSLVILDEVGRGTSTYDGLSLAQAVLEYLVGNCRSMVFFATHYHELTKKNNLFPQIQNGHMSISEHKNQMQFLYTLCKGAANKSYGIQVAQLAGLPVQAIKRAQKILNDLEGGSEPFAQMSLQAQSPEPTITGQKEYKTLLDSIRQVSLQHTTPIEAINKIAQWKETLS